jgi:hypothetical protein
MAAEKPPAGGFVYVGGLKVKDVEWDGYLMRDRFIQ